MICCALFVLFRVCVLCFSVVCVVGGLCWVGLYCWDVVVCRVVVCCVCLCFVAFLMSVLLWFDFALSCC